MYILFNLIIYIMYRRSHGKLSLVEIFPPTTCNRIFSKLFLWRGPMKIHCTCQQQFHSKNESSMNTSEQCVDSSETNCVADKLNGVECRGDIAIPETQARKSTVKENERLSMEGPVCRACHPCPTDVIPSSEYLLEALSTVWLHLPHGNGGYWKGVLLLSTHRLIFVPNEGQYDPNFKPTVFPLIIPIAEIEEVSVKLTWKENYDALRIDCLDSLTYIFATERIQIISNNTHANNNNNNKIIHNNNRLNKNDISIENGIYSDNNNIINDSNYSNNMIDNNNNIVVRPIEKVSYEVIAMDIFQRIKDEISWRKCEDSFPYSVDLLRLSDESIATVHRSLGVYSRFNQRYNDEVPSSSIRQYQWKTLPKDNKYKPSRNNVTAKHDFVGSDVRLKRMASPRLVSEVSDNELLGEGGRRENTSLLKASDVTTMGGTPTSRKALDKALNNEFSIASNDVGKPVGILSPNCKANTCYTSNEVKTFLSGVQSNVNHSNEDLIEINDRDPMTPATYTTTAIALTSSFNLMDEYKRYYFITSYYYTIPYYTIVANLFFKFVSVS